MDRRKSNGREPFIYRARNPSELQGAHADLIASALQPEEKLFYLFYSPIWEGEGGCFGIQGAPASHAVAVTECRFIISRDLHSEGISPSLHAIPFGRILSVELGSAILLGWFSILFAEKGRAARTAILFKTTGINHYAAAVREYRAIGCGWHPALRESHIQSAESAGQALVPQAQRMRHVLLEGERIIHAIHSPRIWGRKKRRWKSVPVCIAGAGAFLMTDLGLLFSADETDMSPKLDSYGANVWCIPRDTVQTASVIEQTRHQIRVRLLKLTLRRDSVSTSLNVPFEKSCTETALIIAREATIEGVRCRKRKEHVCPSQNLSTVYNKGSETGKRHG